jgi:class 3 adenylate cyclase
MAGRPTGTVTLLFTDVESSTRLWEDRDEEMVAALASHDTFAARSSTYTLKRNSMTSPSCAT